MYNHIGNSSRYYHSYLTTPKPEGETTYGWYAGSDRHNRADGGTKEYIMIDFDFKHTGINSKPQILI